MADKWSEGLNPFKGVMKGNRLYGRGAADDGYAPFFTLYMLRAMQEANFSYENLIFIFETNEESDC